MNRRRGGVPKDLAKDQSKELNESHSSKKEDMLARLESPREARGRTKRWEI